MHDMDVIALCEYSRRFSRLNDEKIELLHSLYEDVHPHVPGVTDAFYEHLQGIPKTLPFLEGRLEALKQTHQDWVEELFTSDFDQEYTRKIYHVGDVHVKIKLPVEFMSGAMTVIQSEMFSVFSDLYADDTGKLISAVDAFNSATGFSLLIMQESFQSSTLIHELENFLKITGMSRILFDNLAKAYQ